MDTSLQSGQPAWQRAPPSIQSPSCGSLPLGREMPSRDLKSSPTHPGYSQQWAPEDCLRKLAPLWKYVPPPPIAKCCNSQQQLSVSPQFSGSQCVSSVSCGLDTHYANSRFVIKAKSITAASEPEIYPKKSNWCHQRTAQESGWDTSKAEASTFTATHDVATTGKGDYDYRYQFFPCTGYWERGDASTTSKVVCSPARGNTSGHHGRDYNSLTSLPPSTLSFPPRALPLPPPPLHLPPPSLFIPPPAVPIPLPAVPIPQILPTALSTQITPSSPSVVPATVTVNEPLVTQNSPPVIQCTASSHSTTTTTQSSATSIKCKEYLTLDKILNYSPYTTKNNEPMSKDIEFKVHNYSPSNQSKKVATKTETSRTKYVKPAARRESPAARYESLLARRNSHIGSHKSLHMARRESPHMTRRESNMGRYEVPTARHKVRGEVPTARHRVRCEVPTARHRVRCEVPTARHMVRCEVPTARHVTKRPAVATSSHITTLRTRETYMTSFATSIADHMTPVSRSKSNVASSSHTLKKLSDAFNQPIAHRKKYEEPITHPATPVTRTLPEVQPTLESRIKSLSHIFTTSNDQPMTVKNNVILSTSESQLVPVNKVKPLISQQCDGHPTSVNKHQSKTNVLRSLRCKTELSEVTLCNGTVLKQEVITDMGLGSKNIASLIDESTLEGLAESLPESHKRGDVTDDLLKREDADSTGICSVLTGEASTKQNNLFTAPCDIPHNDDLKKKYIKTENVEKVELSFVKTEEWEDDADSVETKYEVTKIPSRVKKDQIKDKIENEDIFKTEEPFGKAEVTVSADENNLVGRLKSDGGVVSTARPVSGTSIDCNGGSGYLLDEEFLEMSMDTVVPVCVISLPSTEGCSKTVEKSGNTLPLKTLSIAQSHVPPTKTSETLNITAYPQKTDAQTACREQQKTGKERRKIYIDGSRNLEKKPHDSGELIVQNTTLIRKRVKRRKRKRVEGNSEAPSTSKRRHGASSKKSGSRHASIQMSSEEMRRALRTCSYVVQDYVSDTCPIGHHLDPFCATVNVHTYNITALCTTCNITIRMRTVH
nr:uncharacterized protein LOC123753990 [Procambarus clarkii]